MQTLSRFRRILAATDKILESIHEFLLNPFFELIAPLLLGVLVLTGVVTKAVWVSVVLAWLIAVFWISRTGWVKRRTVFSRLVILIATATILAFAGRSFSIWSIRQYRAQEPVQGKPQTSETANANSLKEKYPAGYFLFTGDTQTNFIRKNSESKADFSLDWENCRVTFTDASFVDITLKSFHYFPTKLQIQNLDVVLERKVGTVADGMFFNGMGLFVELIADHAAEIVYVIGIKNVNSVPKIRYPNPEVVQFIRQHLGKPITSGMDTGKGPYISIDDLVMSSGWTEADK